MQARNVSGDLKVCGEDRNAGPGQEVDKEGKKVVKRTRERRTKGLSEEEVVIPQNQREDGDQEEQER